MRMGIVLLWNLTFRKNRILSDSKILLSVLKNFKEF